MQFVDLAIEVQNAILEYCRRNFMEPSEEVLNSLAQIFDSAVDEVLVVGEITGVIGGYSTSQLLSSTRSEILNNMVTQALDMAEKYEQNLMIINYNSIASPLCAKWQDKIYYIYEPVDNYKKLDDNIWHGKKNTSGGNLFHPNCRHQMYAYFPGESDPPKDLEEPNEEDYKLQQELNYIKRNERKYYERKSVAKKTGNSSYEKQNNNWKNWKIRQDEFIKKNGTMRM